MFHVNEGRLVTAWRRPKQHHLRMLGAWGETSSYSYRFSDRQVTTQVVLTRPTHFTGGNEVGFSKSLSVIEMMGLRRIFE